VVINHDIERLRQIELTPFKMGIKAGADGVMTAHIIMPTLPAAICPQLCLKKSSAGFEK